MRIKTRETATGTEYWDNIEKRTVFVPIGEEPGFEFKKRDEVKSMLAKNNEPDPEPIDDVMVLDDMTVKQLKQYAADNEIVIPDGVTKKPDIIKVLTEAE